MSVQGRQAGSIKAQHAAAALLLLLFKLPEQPNELQLPEQAHHLQQSSRWRGWWEACELSWVPSQKAASIQQQTYLLK
jgi:hypothetical protein